MWDRKERAMGTLMNDTMETDPLVHDIVKETELLPSTKALAETDSPERGDRKEEKIPSALALKNILVPIDFSRISRKALEYAVPLAKKFGAKITLLHVFEPLPYHSDMSHHPRGEAFPLRAMESDLEAVVQSCIEPQLFNKAIVDAGIAFEVIIDVARALKIDLIVLTTHGFTGLRHVFMGSTAERVVRHAPCPVFVIRRREHDCI